MLLLLCALSAPATGEQLSIVWCCVGWVADNETVCVSETWCSSIQCVSKWRPSFIP